MTYLAIRPIKGQEQKSWMGVYSFKKEREAWNFLSVLRHTRKDDLEYEEPCSYRLFEEGKETEAKNWAGVTETTGQTWTKQQSISDIIAASNPHDKRDLSFNARKEVNRMRKASNRNVERITGRPNWNRDRERNDIPASEGERLNFIFNFYTRKGVDIVTITFRDGRATTVVFDDVWYIPLNKIEYNGSVYEGDSFDELFNKAKTEIPIEDLTNIITAMAERLPKSNIEAIDRMIFFPEFGTIRTVKTEESDRLQYRMVGTVLRSIMRNVDDITMIAPNKLKYAITDKGILKRLAAEEEFGV